MPRMLLLLTVLAIDWYCDTAESSPYISTPQLRIANPNSGGRVARRGGMRATTGRRARATSSEIIVPVVAINPIPNNTAQMERLPACDLFLARNRESPHLNPRTQPVDDFATCVAHEFPNSGLALTLLPAFQFVPLVQ